MKRLFAFALLLVLLVSAIPAQAASFVFRDHITWGMSSEMVKFWEGSTKTLKADKFTYLKYKNLRVSKYSFHLEYEFVGNKLVAAIYLREYKKSALDAFKKCFNYMKKVYCDKYGKQSTDKKTLQDIIYKYFNFMGIKGSRKDAKEYVKDHVGAF